MVTAAVRKWGDKNQGTRDFIHNVSCVLKPLQFQVPEVGVEEKENPPLSDRDFKATWLHFCTAKQTKSWASEPKFVIYYMWSHLFFTNPWRQGLYKRAYYWLSLAASHKLQELNQDTWLSASKYSQREVLWLFLFEASEIIVLSNAKKQTQPNVINISGIVLNWKRTWRITESSQQQQFFSITLTCSVFFPPPFFKKANTNSIWKQPFQTEDWNLGRQWCQPAAHKGSLASWQEEAGFHPQGVCTRKWHVAPSSLLISSHTGAKPITSSLGNGNPKLWLGTMLRELPAFST